IGLGLNLAQTLVQGMNGTIEVASLLDRGTKFTARLPVWSEEENRETESNANETKFAPVDSVLGAAQKRGEI
ncbi:MAG TPA: ATP-binding protein, partial [Pyrinomonadaceae bacterium]|nr:ATP-binding protein [Pyrinomonadaceae bacterium]